MSSTAAKSAVPARFRPARVRALFDALAETYGWSGWLSGGMLLRWRGQLAGALGRPTGGPARVVDLMAGGADLWPALRRHFGPELHVDAVDFSAPMLARAAAHGAGSQLAVHVADARATPLPSGRATAVTCAFGLKTLPPGEYRALAEEAARLLRPSGEVALVEFVLPGQGWRRQLMHGYLGWLGPLLGWLRPAAAAHQELLRYASLGPDLPALHRALRAAGFTGQRQRRLWPGYAVLVTARVRA